MEYALNYPKLRSPLDVRFENTAEGRVVIIQCPYGVLPEPVILSADVVPVISMMNGVNSIDSILQEFSLAGLSVDLLNNFIAYLDENFLLDTDKYIKANLNERNRFGKLINRRAHLAGLSYPKSYSELGRLLDQYIPRSQNIHHKKKLKVLVSPHIDYQRGGEIYGKAYSQLKAQKHDTYILIGTSHQYSSHLFHLTRKNFDSPLGMIEANQDFIERLSKNYGTRSFADEILHKQEHSLELQLPFLRRTTHAGNIVPILVGSFHNMIEEGKYPGEYEIYESFVDSLVQTIQKTADRGDKLCFIAGVDMAHIGRYFGDSGNLTPNYLKDEIKARDFIYMQCIEKQNKKALFDHVAEDGDKRRICGFPTMYTILDVMERLDWKCKSVISDYDQAVNYYNDCAVTFASMGMYS